jgi:hypothetical protein
MDNQKKPLVQLGTSGVSTEADERQIKLARTEFEGHGWIKLHSLLDENLLDSILMGVESGQFEDFVHPIGVPNRELFLKPCSVLKKLDFLFNNHLFFQIISRLTNCGPIGSFAGRVYRFIPDDRYFGAWHSDDTDHRLLALSLNLSPRAYEGGQLEFRRSGQEEPSQSVSNSGLGDALLFQVSSKDEHRVTPISGEFPRTAFAGWFCSSPDFFERFT